MCTQAIIFAVFSVVIKLDAVPPEACFENFRWENCGGPPVRVLYYWKPGSRCEVGIWRGCLPNMNMFKNEYECVSTCIFTARAQAPDYHKIYYDDVTEVTTASVHTTEIESTTGEDATTTTEAGSNNATGAADGVSTAAGDTHPTT